MNSTAEPGKCIRYGCGRKRDRVSLLCERCRLESDQRKAARKVKGL